MTYDELLKEPSDKEKILQFICDSRMWNDDLEEYPWGWNDALNAVADFIENKL